MNTTTSTTAIYVGDLHPDVTETHLYDSFKAFGSILSIRVCRDIITRRSLGYAYVNFSSSDDATKAIDSARYAELMGIPMRVMVSHRDPARRKSQLGNIFIKNLHKDIDTRTLHDTFAAFGSILSCKIATDEHGRSKGYGFIHFETEGAADKAITTVDGMLLKDKKSYCIAFRSQDKTFTKRKRRKMDQRLHQKSRSCC